jgi:hypothetical protein
VAIGVLGTERIFMAKSNKGKGDPDDLSTRIKKLLRPDHEESLAELIAEGNRLLAEETKNPLKKPVSNDSVKLQEKLGSMSNNPYVRARTEILKKMTPEARAILEQMSSGKKDKDNRWETFCSAISKLGEKFYLAS